MFYRASICAAAVVIGTKQKIVVLQLVGRTTLKCMPTVTASLDPLYGTAGKLLLQGKWEGFGILPPRKGGVMHLVPTAAALGE